MARFLLKVSGEGLSGERGFGTDPDRIGELAASLSAAQGRGHELAVIVGGGNYFRGADMSRWTIPRAEGDNVGILGTIINGIFLRGALAEQGISDGRLMTAVTIPAMAEPYVRLRAERHRHRRGELRVRPRRLAPRGRGAHARDVLRPHRRGPVA